MRMDVLYAGNAGAVIGIMPMNGLYERRRYGSMDRIGSVESGTEVQSNARSDYRRQHECRR